MATIAAKASTPANVSFGLCNRIRSSRPRSASASTAIACAPRRRRGRGMSSSSAIRLGTFLHLVGLLRWSRSRRGVERRDIARRLVRRRRENQRQRDRHDGSLVDLALHGHFAGMKADQAFHDRQAEAGAFMAPLIGLARLKERIADTLEIVGGDADPGIADAQHHPRALDRGGNRYRAAAFG